MSNKTNRIILCMAGSGRSGTSLVSSFLHRSGITMGSEMRGPSKSNRLGYFEDLEFLNFHKKIMENNRVDRYTPWKCLDIKENDHKIAQTIIKKKNKQHHHWGWKDPRTNMLFDFWTSIEPDIKFLIMYRNPEEVMTSMYREQRRLIRYLHPTYAPKTWIINNLQSLDFSLRNFGSVAFIDLNKLIEKPQATIDALSEWLVFPLSIKIWKDVYKPPELRATKRSKFNEPIINTWVKIARALYGSEMQHVYKTLSTVALVK